MRIYEYYDNGKLVKEPSISKALAEADRLGESITVTEVWNAGTVQSKHVRRVVWDWPIEVVRAELKRLNARK